MTLTPLKAGMPVVLIHARGKMTPNETDFWVRLRMALRDRGWELVLMAHNVPKSGGMDVPLLIVPNGLDAVYDYAAMNYWMPSTPPGPKNNDDMLLAQERARSPLREDVERRRVALNFFREFYAAALLTVEPSLCLVWNGQHAQELILVDYCRQCGCPVGFIERAPFPGLIHVDEEGILGGSRLARKASFEWSDDAVRDHWHGVMSEVTRAYANAPKTWWEQPEHRGADEIRKAFGIRPGMTVVLFAGQVDEDAQNLEYSPHFSGSLEAFTWFCKQLSTRPDVFILGKHHPKSSTPLSAFSAAVGDQGVWTDQFSLNDCLGVACRVAAVNSTVLYEGLMKGIPVLALGQLLLIGKEIAYEVSFPDQAGRVIQAWLDGNGFEARLSRWKDFGAYALSSCFYSMESSAEAMGLQGAAGLAERCLSLKMISPCQYDKLPAVSDSILSWLSRWPQVATLPDPGVACCSTCALDAHAHHKLPWRRVWLKLKSCIVTPSRIVRRLLALWQGRTSNGIQTIAATVEQGGRKGRLSGHRMLVVSHAMFWEIGNGTAYRFRGLLLGLAAHGTEIHVVHLGDVREGALTPAMLREFGVSSVTIVPYWQAGCRGARYLTQGGEAVGFWRFCCLEGPTLKKTLPADRRLEDYRSPALARTVARLAHRLEIDSFLLLYTYMYWLTKRLPATCVTIVDTIDVLHLRQASFQSSALKHPVLISRADESSALAYFDIIIAIQHQEAAVLASMVPSKCSVVTCLPALLETSHESKRVRDPVKIQQRDVVLYVASSNAANADGLATLLDKIWPLVLKSRPEATLNVCGSVCNNFKSAVPHGVALRGRVPDLSAMYASAAVVVNPVKVGSGLKIKILEGLGHGCPVVATTHSVDGFPDVSDSGIVVADCPEKFAAAVISFLSDTVLRSRVSAQGRRYAERWFSPSTVIEPLVESLLWKASHE